MQKYLIIFLDQKHHLPFCERLFGSCNEELWSVTANVIDAVVRNVRASRLERKPGMNDKYAGANTVRPSAN